MERIKKNTISKETIQCLIKEEYHLIYADDILNNIMKSMLHGGPPPNINQNSPFGNPFFKMFVNGQPVHPGRNHLQTSTDC